MTTDDGLLTRLAVKIRQGVCALHGHDSLLHFDNGRISLMCFSCGHESPGWEVGGRAARTARRRRRSQAACRASCTSPTSNERRVALAARSLNVPSSPVAPAS